MRNIMFMIALAAVSCNSATVQLSPVDIVQPVIVDDPDMIGDDEIVEVDVQELFAHGITNING